MLHPRETNNLYGHQNLESAFLSSFQNNKLHHAWLLTGEQGIGKATFAYQAAKLLLSNKVSENLTKLSEGWCEKTVSKIHSLSHTDLHILHEETSVTGESGDIKINTVRELIRFCNLTSLSSQYKVIIIDSIDDLNINAANALLKQLEEPYHDTIFFLVCHNLGKILHTIRSRCRVLKFHKLSQEDFIHALKSQNISVPKNLYEICNGSLNLAASLLECGMIDLPNVIYKLLLTKVFTQESLQLIQKLSEDKLWNITCSMIELTLCNLIKNDVCSSNDAFSSFDKLQFLNKVRLLLNDTNNLYLDRTQALMIIFKGYHDYIH